MIDWLWYKKNIATFGFVHIFSRACSLEQQVKKKIDQIIAYISLIAILFSEKHITGTHPMGGDANE